MATLQHPFEKKLDGLAIRAARVCVDSGLHQVEARVVAAFDMSPDMGPAYLAGTVHEFATAALALALRFDDDGIVPVWTFQEAASFAGEMKREDHVSFLMRNVLPPNVSASRPVGRTPSRFVPLIHRIGESLFGADWRPDAAETPSLTRAHVAATPALVLVFTGGDCADQAETEVLLRYASHFPVFWQFVGITDGRADDSRFAFLRHMDVLVGGNVDGCGFFAPDVALGMEAVFTGLVSEFPGWLELPDVQAMLTPRPLSGPVTRVDPTPAIEEIDQAEELARAAERLERDKRRAARAVATVEGAEAWPRAGDAGGLPEAGAELRRGQTRPMAPSHWRLEAVRERPWELPGDPDSGPLSQEGSAASLTDDAHQTLDPQEDTPSERLARIRRRREERRG